MKRKEALEAAKEFKETVFDADPAWKSALESAQEEPQDLADAFFAGTPSSDKDAFDLAEAWIKKVHPNKELSAQELLFDVAAIANAEVAGVDDGISVLIDRGDYAEELAESLQCRMVERADHEKCRFVFNEVRKAVKAFAALEKSGYSPTASKRLSHTLRGLRFLK